MYAIFRTRRTPPRQSRDNELYHHGVKGMKWGVRRYQNPDGSLTKAGKDRIKNERINRKIDQYVKSGKARVTDLEQYTVGELTTFSKDGESWLSALTGGEHGDGHDFDWQEVSKAPGTDEYKSAAHLIKESLTTDPSRYMFDENSYMAQAHRDGCLIAIDLKKTNPTYGAPGTTQNCAKCASNLELQLRGFDVTAGRQTYPSSVDAMSFWFKGAQRVDYDYDSAEAALKSYGKKTSGTLSFRYPNGAGGHAVHWTNDAYGRFEIQDGQNGTVYDSLSSLLTATRGDKSAKITTFRLDNCEPDWDNMAQDGVIRFSQGTYSNQGGENKVRNKFTGRVVDTW